MSRRLEPFQRKTPDRRRPWAVPFLVAALVFHLVALVALHAALPYITPEASSRNTAIQVVFLDPPETDAEEEEPEVPVFEGQIVEVAPPEEEQKPEEADYLSEHNIVVEEETKTDKFKINPEILAPKFSKEEKLEQEDLVDLHIDKPSTGAQVGNHRFDPDRDGSLAALPSPWTQTNKPGPQDPVPASHLSSAISGAVGFTPGVLTGFPPIKPASATSRSNCRGSASYSRPSLVQ